MNSTITTGPEPGIILELGKLYGLLSRRRKLQLVGLFATQALNAFLEVASLGALVPFLGALTNIGAVSGMPVVGPLLANFQLEQPAEIVFFLTAVFGAAVVAASIGRFLSFRYVLYVTAQIGTDLGQLMFTRLLHRPFHQFAAQNSSEVVGTMTNDLGMALSIVYNALIFLTRLLVSGAIALALLAYNPMLSLILTAAVSVCYVLILNFVRKRLHSNSRIRSDAQRRMIQALQEGFHGIRYIILDRTQSTFVHRYTYHDRRFRMSAANSSVIGEAPRFALEAVAIIAICGVIVVSAWRGDDIAALLPFFGVLAMSAYRLLPAIQQLYASASMIHGGKVSLTRVLAMLSPEEATAWLVPYDESPLVLNEILRVDRVSYSHGSPDDWTLHDISFTVPARSVVALVGPTGSGKSTMSDLLLGLLMPQCGSITVDGVVLDDKVAQRWHKSVSHVPQTIFLADASIAENIAFGVDPTNVDQQRVVEVAKKAQLHEFVTSLPLGYQATVGEAGVRLSGGQRQRIGIARARYKNASLILFDEATSALDNNTESSVMEAIETLRESVTVVLIAHRLSTIRNANKVVMFEDGKVVDQGSYNELMETSERFRRLSGTLGVQ